MSDENQVRDNHGKFCRGHPLLNEKDQTTGRFVRKPRAEDIIVLKIPDPEPVAVVEPEPVSVVPEPVSVVPEPVKPKEPTIIKPSRVLHRWD